MDGWTNKPLGNFIKASTEVGTSCPALVNTSLEWGGIDFFGFQLRTVECSSVSDKGRMHRP